MKKGYFFIGAFLFLLTTISCSSNGDSSSASIDTTQLVGTWLLDNAKLDGEDVDSSYKVQFTSAERAKFYYKNPTSSTTFGPDIIDNGDYALVGNSFTVVWDNPEPGNETDTFQILELTPAKLIVKSSDDEGTLIETYIK